MSKYSIDSWTNQLPTEENVGQWFFVKQEVGGAFPFVKLYEVRLDEQTKELYLCEACYEGLQACSYGVMLRLFKPQEKHTFFSGPVQLPPDFETYRKGYYASKHRMPGLS